MLTRTAKLYGGIDSDTNVTVQFNNREVFSGPLMFIGDTDENGCGPLAQWEIPIDEFGTIPCSISVNNGDLLFISIHMNYVGGYTTFAIKPDAVWPKYVPDTIDNLESDIYNMSDLEFGDKYGITKKQAQGNLEIVNQINTVDYYSDPNTTTIESDGKDNVLLNGVPKVRIVLSENQLGKWHYNIKKSQRLDFDYTVLPPVLDN